LIAFKLVQSVLLEVGCVCHWLVDCPAGGGEVYVWDMQRRMCCHKFVDDGCGTLGTSLAVSTGNQYLAAGYHYSLLIHCSHGCYCGSCHLSCSVDWKLLFGSVHKAENGMERA